MKRFIERQILIAKKAENSTFNEEERQILKQKLLRNMIVYTRRCIREIIKEQSDERDERDIIRRDLALEQSRVNPDISFIQECNILYDLLSFDINEFDTYLAELGGMVMSLLEEYRKAGASLHDFCQVAGINYQVAIDEVKRIKAGQENESASRQEDEELFLKLILHHAELPRSAKNADNIIGSEVEMPLLNAFTEFIVASIEQNQELKKTVNEKLYRCFPELRSNMVTFDSNGNMSKFYPPLMLM